MTKKKLINVGDIVEWMCMDMMVEMRFHSRSQNGGKKEKIGDAMVNIVRLIQSTGRTYDDAIKTTNERFSGVIKNIDGADVTIIMFQEGSYEIKLPYKRIVKVVNKLS